jgi:gamma-glutamylcyclotransferase (GGCT)/AIG2-like uncharacterized protein YtfP/catechol 2,3-dioxygenase-like lactoylglutathione lyase family enzyme
VSDRLLLFVYGTLRAGEDNHAHLAGRTLLGPARTAARYTLADLGPYPALLEGGTTAVVGELYAITTEDLPRLDDLEEHPDLFRRVSVQLDVGAGGDSTAAEVVGYVWPRALPEGARIIEGGDWVRRPRALGEAHLPPAEGVHHLALQVADLPAVERFYRDVLGLPVVRRWPRPDGAGERAVWLDLGRGGFLALETVPPETRGPDMQGQPGYFLLALRIQPSTRAAWSRRLAAAGHPIHQATDFTIYVRDPEGNRVGLSHYPVPAPDPAP